MFPSVRSAYHVRERGAWLMDSVCIFIFLTDTLGWGIKTHKLCNSSHPMNLMQNVPMAFFNILCLSGLQTIAHETAQCYVGCLRHQCVCDFTKQASSCLSTNMTFPESLGKKKTKKMPPSSKILPNHVGTALSDCCLPQYQHWNQSSQQCFVSTSAS